MRLKRRVPYALRSTLSRSKYPHIHSTRDEDAATALTWALRGLSGAKTPYIRNSQTKNVFYKLWSQDVAPRPKYRSNSL